MKLTGKLFGFGVALLAIATIGTVQLTASAAQPGQVGSAPRCDVEAKGARSSAFTVNGGKATVDFVVKGSANCKVQVSSNSFYAPTMNGKPYDQQILFDRTTKTYSTPGTYTMAVSMPVKSTQQKGCFYQVDLTYGTHNVQPVLAYGHGKLDCSLPSSITCKDLTVTPIANTSSYRLDASATATNTTAKSFTFTVTKNGAVVANQSVAANNNRATLNYTQATPGSYTVRATAVSESGKTDTGSACVKPLTVQPPAQPRVDIVKYVDGTNKYKRVGVNVEYTYRVVVSNPGNVDLTNVVLTDTPDRGITLISVSPNAGTIKDNTWTYTMPSLPKGTELTFTFTAKVPVYLAGKLVNTVCVDAPQVPGNPDKCDKAEVDVPPAPGQLQVCVLADKSLQTINESDFDSTKHSKNPDDCKETPAELPQTGPVDTIMQIIGAMSLVSASAYYISSRRAI